MCPQMSVQVTSSKPILQPGWMDFRGTVAEIGCSELFEGSALLDVAVSTGGVLPTAFNFLATDGCVKDPDGIPLCTLGTVAAGSEESYTIDVEVVDASQSVMVCLTATSSNAAPVMDCIVLEPGIFYDDFESGDTSGWSSTVGGI